MVSTRQRPSAKRDHAINIRSSEQQRDLIDRAAQAIGQSRSEFMIEASCREAATVLLDQVFFSLDAAAFDQFQAMLDSPPPPTDELRALLLTKAPWE
ncbi:MAG: DUF1778 domain-containing protein [Chloroflexota bacterium]|nr:DUF1778 domain-containing protein [Chloroflexota bacterium]